MALCCNWFWPGVAYPGERRASVIVYFDLETGGTEERHPIIQLAAVAHSHNGEELGTYNERLKFDPAQCDPEALAINHYSAEKWLDAIEPLEAVTRFSKWIKKFASVKKTSKKGKTYYLARLAGYNSIKFDAPRLERLFREHDRFLPADKKVLDVFQLVLWWLQVHPEVSLEDTKLGTVCTYFGIELEEAHDALPDTRATAELGWLLQKKLLPCASA